MSLRKEVELIIEHNITKRTQVNHYGWDPCATSTPVRKPLNTLNNFEPGFGYNQCDVIPRNISFKTTPKKLGEGQNFEGNSSKKIAKKNKAKSRNNSLLNGRDDEETDDNEHNEVYPKDNETKKNLIIKLGSNEFDNKRIKRTRSTEAVKKEVSQNSVGKGQNEIIKKKTICKSANIKSKPKANNSCTIVSEPCEKRKKKSGNSSDSGNTETTKSAVSNDSFKNNFFENEKCLMSDLPETEKDTEADNISCKRKTKIDALNHVVSKKPKSDIELEVTGLNTRNGDLVEEVKYTEDCVDKSVKESKTKLSTSHEIFSENKERELRDSLDLTATPVTKEFNDNPKSDQSQIIQVFQKKQRVIPKKRISCSKNKLKLKTTLPNKIDTTNERPKRARKSPKEFWLPKSEDSKLNKDLICEVNDNVKEKEVELSSPSTIQLGETSRKKIMTLKKNGSSSSFTNKDFFKDVREMEFTEIPSNGNEREVYSYALGWKFPTYKCGALKIGRNCESSGRTEYENSYLGGVLLEGKLLMKIQENEVELSSGQMFCVPPLTEWKATNITRKDCILYYWCGRF